MGIWGDERELIAQVREEQAKTIDIVLSGYRSIVGDVAYASMPITSGVRQYEIFERHGVKSLAELAEQDPDAPYMEVIRPNIEDGVLRGQELAGLTDLPLVLPSVFEAKKDRWSQPEYMTMWQSFIEEKVREGYMLDGWEYSNGGAEEFTRFMEMQHAWIWPEHGYAYHDGWSDPEKAREDMRRIRVMDERGETMPMHEGAGLIAAAIIDLGRRGFSAPKLERCFGKLQSIAGHLYDTLTDRKEWRYHVRDEVDYGFILDAGEALQSYRRRTALREPSREFLTLRLQNRGFLDFLEETRPSVRRYLDRKIRDDRRAVMQ